MTVTLTSPAMGLAVGDDYTGPAEPWLVAEGYGHTAGDDTEKVDLPGPAVDDDLTLAENREDPGELDSDDMANADPTQRWRARGHLEKPEAGFTLDPNSGAAAGGDDVTISGHGFEGVTSVTFGGTAGTGVEVVDDKTVKVTTPAHAAGAVDVVMTDEDGSTTVVGGFTYA